MEVYSNQIDILNFFDNKLHEITRYDYDRDLRSEEIRKQIEILKDIQIAFLKDINILENGTQ